jgi:hypothetical protein
VRSIISHSRPPGEAEKWLELAGIDNVGYHLCILNLRLARLCAEAQVLFDSTGQNEVWVLGLMCIVKEAIILDLGYDGWSETTYEAWPYHKLRMCSTQVNASDKASSTIPQTSPPHIYHDIWVAFIWNQYRSCRIHLHEVLLHSLDLLQSHPIASSLSIDPQATQDQSRLIISDLLSDICDSVPFCIGDIDSTGKPLDAAKRIPLGGYLLIWPLYVASVSAEEGSIRHCWIQEKLGYISRVMGLHKAHLLAERPRKEPWDLE